MAKNDLTLLDSILDDYLANKKPSSKSDEVFEFFSAEQILKDYAFSTADIQKGSVDGRNDGGIDYFYTIVNGHLIENIPAGYLPKSDVVLEVFIFTCKHDDSFKQAPITTMIPSLSQLLDFSIPSSQLVEYNEKIISKRNGLLSTIKAVASFLVKFDLHIIYACRGDEKIEANIQAKADQAVSICNSLFSACNATFEFWGNSKLLARYRERANNNADLVFEQCITQNGQYIVLASLMKYYNFLLDARGNLNKRLFDSNVRDYLGLNPVNNDILKSLAKENGPNFWWLNNGITIIGTKAVIVGNTLTISDVQIVNGLQTSESLYNHFSGKISGTPIGSDTRSILIKILVSSDKSVNDEIIFATNNQTNVNVAALRATDKIQMDIEDILRSNQIYYERRPNYYQNQGISSDLIISPLTLAAGFITLIYKNPCVATSLKQKFMRNNAKYDRVFCTTVDLNVWVAIAALLMKTDKFISELKSSIPGSLFRVHKYYRHLILFTAVSRLLGTFAFDDKMLIHFDRQRYTRNEVDRSIRDLLEVSSDCFTRTKKPKQSFYPIVYQHIAKKYNIKAIQVIPAKNEQLITQSELLSAYGLSNTIIQQIKSKLPAQPWPRKIHVQIAQELNLTDKKVSDAISYLIYSNEFNHQIYGYVFDDEGSVIVEGEHYGRSVEDARIKLKEQISLYNQKFGF